MIEKYFEGKEITYLNKDGYPKMDPLVWQMFLRFVDFWETYKPTLIETEVHLFSEELKVAGTCDLFVKLMESYGLLILKHLTIYKQLMIYKVQHMLNVIKNVMVKSRSCRCFMVKI
jgi:hypothetical protein